MLDKKALLMKSYYEYRKEVYELLITKQLGDRFAQPYLIFGETKNPDEYKFYISIPQNVVLNYTRNLRDWREHEFPPLQMELFGAKIIDRSSVKLRDSDGELWENIQNNK